MAGGRPNKKAVLVRELLKKDPTAKNQDIAEKVGCTSYYVGKLRRESTEAATLGSVRKTKKKPLPLTEPRQSDDDSEFSYHEKRIIDRLGFGDTERKTAFDTGYPMSLVKKTKEKAIKKYGATRWAREKLFGYEAFESKYMSPKYSRAGLLDQAKEIITNDRQNTHGQPEDSFRRIADLWSGYLTVGVREEDVAVMMALVKVARIMENPRHADNWIDGAGYFACGGEVALRKK